MSALIFSMSAGVAHADPSFVLAESQAHAGDAVHFTITGAEDHVTYDIEVAGKDVLKGSADTPAGVTSGQFTMPDLGTAAKSVTVEAELEDEDDEETVKRKLQYLGKAPAVAETPAAPAPAAPAAPQSAGSAPASSPPPAAKAPSAPAPAVKHGGKRSRKHARKRRAAKRHERSSRPDRSRRSGSPSGSRSHVQERSRESAPPKRKRGRRPAARTAPLFNGVPEADTGGSSVLLDDEPKERRRKLLPAVIAAEVAGHGDPGEPAVAILVPGALALAGFLLAAGTLVRRRRHR